MKKQLALLLAMAMVLALAACGNNSAPVDTTPAGTTPADTTPTEPADAIDPAVAEAEIRYAISLLFDRNYIVEEIGQAGQVPLPPSSPWA